MGFQLGKFHQGDRMSPVTEVPALSLGYALDMGPVSCGVVHSVFRHAVNVMVCGEMWTLLAEAKSDLPFGIRVALRDFDTLGLQRGEPVHVRLGFVGIDSRFVVDCRSAARWVPLPGSAPAPGMMQRLSMVVKSARGRSWSGSADMALAVKSAMRAPATLDHVLAKIIGCGPGATPSGDDVLAGIFAVLTSPQSQAAGERDAELLRRALLPLLPATTDLSAHLLRQAAYGLSGRDLHELVSSLIGNPSPAQLSDAIRQVVETGATSGADTCEGLLAFAPSYFNQQTELAAA
jgi:hypothetical protein